MLRVAVFLVGVAAASAAYPSSVGTVYVDNDGKLTFKAVLDPSGVAFGNFTDQSIHPSAFGHLVITTNAQYNDTVQATAAGFLEGVLTSVRTKEHFDNLNSWLLKQFPGKTELVRRRCVAPEGVPVGFVNFRVNLCVLVCPPQPAKYTAWMTAQDAFMRQQIQSNSSDFWTQMSFIVAQFDGLVAGIASVNATLLSTMDLAVLNAIGDFLDLVPALDPSTIPDFATMEPDALKVRGRSAGRRSGRPDVRTLTSVVPLYSTMRSLVLCLRLWEWCALFACLLGRLVTCFSCGCNYSPGDTDWRFPFRERGFLLHCCSCSSPRKATARHW